MLGRIAVWTLPGVPRSVVRAVAARYVAGETMKDALETVKMFNSRGVVATVDLMGENSSPDQADDVLREYTELARRLKHGDLKSGISVKPSHFGAHEAPAAAFERIKELVAHCQDLGVFVRLDMEDSSMTDLTLEYHEDLTREFDNVGVVVQAYLKRTARDMEKLARMKASVRLCIGIYNESSEIAYKKRAEISKNYVELVKFYMKSGGFLGVATHDRGIIGEVEAFVQDQGIDPKNFEYQSLMGVPVDDLIARMVENGYAWRVYVPYGAEWYDYSVRRLKENPKIAGYIIKQFFGGKR